jgi:hypothetical protein
MTAKNIFAFVAAISLVASPALAQTTNNQGNGHHYQGGPKTEVPHHMGKKEAIGTTTQGLSGGHHYQGGPKTVVPHDMGEKQ